MIGSIGPSLVGLLLTLRASGRQGARGLLKRAAGLGRITLRWWAAMVGLAALPNLGALLLAAGMHGKAPDLSKALELAGTPLALLSIAAFALAAGVAEEGGWRGFALERLRFRRSALAASVVIGVAWSLWHLPLFFLDGTYQNELGFGSAAFWWFMAEKLPLAVLFTWIYEGSGGLVAAAIAFHAIGNIVGDVFPAGGGARWVSLAILVGLAGAIAARWRDRTPHDHAGQQVEPL
ncbi:MAG TPA: CPBP family intramembrane glutamic endopeptidase [Actinomycetes bacterium]|nr:CPBP family intramembrane glutamic endopeptidase [Actinomycetes bacterium]